MATKQMTNGRAAAPVPDSAKTGSLVIPRPHFPMLDFPIIGTAPYVQQAMSEKTKRALAEQYATQEGPARKKTRVKRNYDEDMANACHRSEEGWYGIPAPAFRAACIDVMRMTNYKMTNAKMSIFCRGNGWDAADPGTSLVRLIAPPPRQRQDAMRNTGGGVDIRIRPEWRYWMAVVTLRWDGGQFDAQDVLNLLTRAGEQVGIGEGRPFSKDSYGQGWGTFEVLTEAHILPMELHGALRAWMAEYRRHELTPLFDGLLATIPGTVLPAGESR